MARMVELDNTAYSMFQKLDKNVRGPPPSAFNGYSIDHTTLPPTPQNKEAHLQKYVETKLREAAHWSVYDTDSRWAEPINKKVTNQRTIEDSQHQLSAGETRRANMRKFQTSAIVFGEDDPSYSQMSTMPDHSSEIVFDDCRRNFLWQKYNFDEKKENNSKHLKVSVQLQHPYGDDNERRRKTSTKSNRGGFDPATQAKINLEKKKLLQSSSKGMLLGIDSISYESEFSSSQKLSEQKRRQFANNDASKFYLNNKSNNYKTSMSGLLQQQQNDEQE